jgi:hypothetical protein
MARDEQDIQPTSLRIRSVAVSERLALPDRMAETAGGPSVLRKLKN